MQVIYVEARLKEISSHYCKSLKEAKKNGYRTKDNKVWSSRDFEAGDEIIVHWRDMNSESEQYRTIRVDEKTRVFYPDYIDIRMTI